MSLASPWDLIFAIVVFTASLWVGLALHELGHLMAARLVGLPIKAIVIGTGPVLFRHQGSRTSYALHLFPKRGFVRLETTLISRRFSNICFVTGGALANGFSIYLLYIAESRGIFKSMPSILLTAIYFGQAFYFLTLLPGPSKTPGISGTDGAQLLRLIFTKKKTLGRPGELYIEMAQKYMPEMGRDILKSTMAPNVFSLLANGEELTSRAVGERGSEIQRLLKIGTLSSIEEALLLDCLITDALLSRDPVNVLRIDEWSLRSLSLAVNTLAILTP